MFCAVSTMASSKTVEKKLVKSKSGLRIVAINEYLRSVLLLPEPEWKADAKVCKIVVVMLHCSLLILLSRLLFISVFNIECCFT